jgi:hypothetical protein
MAVTRGMLPGADFRIDISWVAVDIFNNSLF